jgi:hypothetical protein
MCLSSSLVSLAQHKFPQESHALFNVECWEFLRLFGQQRRPLSKSDGGHLDLRAVVNMENATRLVRKHRIDDILLMVVGFIPYDVT